MAENHYMTAEGLEKLKKELAEALAQRPEIAAAIAEAREKGDLSENAEYDAAREAQGLLELKIAKLQNQISSAKVVDSSQLNADTVSMLTKVKVENLNAKAVMEFTIVGESEADFSKGKLAATIPDEETDIVFDTISYTEKDLGTHYYEVTENIPSTGALGGITYDDSVFHVAVNVTDNYDGTLKCTMDKDSDEIAFVNKYLCILNKNRFDL